MSATFCSYLFQMVKIAKRLHPADFICHVVLALNAYWWHIRVKRRSKSITEASCIRFLKKYVRIRSGCWVSRNTLTSSQNRAGAHLKLVDCVFRVLWYCYAKYVSRTLNPLTLREPSNNIPTFALYAQIKLTVSTCMCLSSQVCDLSRVLVYKTLRRLFEGMLIPRNTF